MQETGCSTFFPFVGVLSPLLQTGVGVNVLELLYPPRESVKVPRLAPVYLRGK